jgi:hypothetical protein
VTRIEQLAIGLATLASLFPNATISGYNDGIFVWSNEPVPAEAQINLPEHWSQRPDVRGQRLFSFSTE